MKRDFDQVLLDLDGQPFQDKATLKSVTKGGMKIYHKQLEDI